MKSYKQVSEIIDSVQLFHQQMRAFYESLHKDDEKQRVKIMLDYLSRHEKHREETLAQYEAEASNKIMDTWFKYIPENTTSNCLDGLEIKSDMSIDDVIHIAFDLNNCLIEMYKKIIANTDIKEVREMFKSLLLRIEKEEKNLSRDVSWLYDV